MIQKVKMRLSLTVRGKFAIILVWTIFFGSKFGHEACVEDLPMTLA